MPCLALSDTPPVPPGGYSRVAVQVPLRLVSGVEATLTRCRITLLTLLGEWPADESLGLPLTVWASTPAPLVEIQGWVTAQLASVPGVVEVLSVIATRGGGVLRISARVRIVSIDDTTSVYDISDYPDWASGANQGNAGAWWTLIPPSGGGTGLGGPGSLIP